MDKIAHSLNAVLMDTYHNILRIEERTLKENSRVNLSIAEMHMIECIGKSNRRTVSSIAKELGITCPSATVAVNKLMQKGYVRKESSEKDGRIVKVSLTHSGEVINRYHRYYHRLMVKELTEEFSDEEQECLVRAIKKLNDYFLESLGEKGKKR